MTDLKCPECGADVSATGISGATGLGTGGGNIAWQPDKEHTTCPNPKCGAKLERNVEPPMDQWRTAPTEQPD